MKQRSGPVCEANRADCVGRELEGDEIDVLDFEEVVEELANFLIGEGLVVVLLGDGLNLTFDAGRLAVGNALHELVLHKCLCERCSLLLASRYVRDSKACLEVGLYRFIRAFDPEQTLARDRAFNGH